MPPVRVLSLWLAVLIALGASPLWALAAGTGAGARPVKAPPVEHTPLVALVVLHDTMQPVSAQTLREQMRDALAQHPVAILLDLSTPGGLPESAKDIAGILAASPVPVVVYLRQPGTHVAGEGLRLLQAGAATVMLPESRLVPLLPERLRSGTGKEHTAQVQALNQVLLQPLRNQGRSAAMLEDLLTSPDPILPSEALQAGLVDAVTPKDEDALRVLDSKLAASAVAGAPHENVANGRVVAQPLSFRQHLMRALMNPDLTVFLLTLGALLIFLEINTPGAIIPGAAGVLLVLLSTYALLQMPLRWQGVGLLMLSAGMVFAEAQFPRGSAFGVGAVIALTLGLRLLVRGPIPEMEVDWGTSIGAGVGFGGITAGLVLLGMRARRAKVQTGADAMLGWLAITQTPLQPAGEVLVRGELWRARLSDPNSSLPAGECVKVQSSDGVTLEVSPMPLAMQPEPDAVVMANS